MAIFNSKLLVYHQLSDFSSHQLSDDLAMAPAPALSQLQVWVSWRWRHFPSSRTGRFGHGSWIQNDEEIRRGLDLE
jgi:hypothetical protein